MEKREVLMTLGEYADLFEITLAPDADSSYEGKAVYPGYIAFPAAQWFPNELKKLEDFE